MPRKKVYSYRREVVECRGCGARGVLGERAPAYVQISKWFATQFKTPQPMPGIYCSFDCAIDAARREGSLCRS